MYRLNHIIPRDCGLPGFSPWRPRAARPRHARAAGRLPPAAARPPPRGRAEWGRPLAAAPACLSGRRARVSQRARQRMSYGQSAVAHKHDASEGVMTWMVVICKYDKGGMTLGPEDCISRIASVGSVKEGPARRRGAALPSRAARSLPRGWGSRAGPRRVVPQLLQAYQGLRPEEGGGKGRRSGLGFRRARSGAACERQPAAQGRRRLFATRTASGCC